MNPTPIAPIAWLSRRAVAKALTDTEGLPISEATLASMVTRGDGPPFRINNRVAEYQWGPTLAWRKARLRYRGTAPETIQHQDAA